MDLQYLAALLKLPQHIAQLEQIYNDHSLEYDLYSVTGAV